MNTVYNQTAISETQRDYMSVAGTVHCKFFPSQFYLELLA